jgi:hypothetical protein
MIESTPQRIYQLKRPRLNRALFLIDVALVLAGAIILSIQQIAHGWGVDSSALLALYVASCGFSLFIIYRSSTQQLSLWDNGIEYRGTYSTWYSDWSGIRIEENHFLPGLFGRYHLVFSPRRIRRYYWPDWQFTQLLGINRYSVRLSDKFWDGYSMLLTDLVSSGVTLPDVRPVSAN